MDARRWALARLFGCVASLAWMTLLVSCERPAPRVEVALVTDAAPGLEFHFVELVLLSQDAEATDPERFARVQVSTGERFDTPRSMTRFLPTAPGRYDLDVRLLARDSVRPLLSRHLTLDVQQDMRVVVQLDRACIAVECPASGAPGATECVGGRCEDPACVSSPLACPTRTGCMRDEDCAVNSTCATPVCSDGVCFAFPTREACPDDSYCDLARGCVPYERREVCGQHCLLDGCREGYWDCEGVDMTCVPFLIRPAGSSCGAGVCSEEGECSACEEGRACDTGNPCEIGVIRCDSGGEVCTPTGPSALGTPCRDAVGVCDVAEVCDGTRTVCPPDALLAGGTTCRASLGVCDVAEVCDGLSAMCPADARRGASEVCRASLGVCDAEELCDGAGVDCPVDALRAAGTSCRDAIDACDARELCDGVGAACPPDALVAAGSACRSSTGMCDVEEQCTGDSAACPINAFSATGAACDAGFCDGGGLCLDTCTPGAACNTGNPCEQGRIDCSSGTPRCLGVGPGHAGTVCRLASGPCDEQEVCSGTSTMCPADQMLSAATTCRAASGICDAAETCDGLNPLCPPDVLATAGTVCRAAAAGCDVAEVCSGTATTCPADRVAPATTVCRPSAGFCDVAEACSGTTSVCPADGFRPASVVCRASAGVCDLSESCSGSEAACPTDVFRGAETVCRASARECDAAEVCSGAAAACPPNGYQPVLTSCTTGQCDAAGICAIERDCDHRWRVAMPLPNTSKIVASTRGVAALMWGTWPPRAAGFRETDGSSVWSYPVPGSSLHSGASANYFFVGGRNVHGANWAAYDIETGAVRATIAHTNGVSELGWAYSWMGVNATGTSFLIPTNVNLPSPTWSLTVTGAAAPLTGVSPTSLLISHDASGNYATHAVTGSGNAVVRPYPLSDGRWAVLAGSATLSGHVVPAGTYELVFLNPDLSFEQAITVPITNPSIIQVGIGATDLILLSDNTNLWAYNTSGLVWMRPDCGGTGLGASATEVFVGARWDTTRRFCGRPMPSGSAQRDGRVAVLDAATGMTLSTRMFPLTNTAQIAVSNDGDVYFTIESNSAVCGVTMVPQSILAF